MNAKRIKVLQAVLICLGYDDRGKLIADGDWGEHSQNALDVYFIQEGVDEIPTGEDPKQWAWENQLMSDGFGFDLEEANCDDNKVMQALLIAQGYGDDELVADGELDEHTFAASMKYLRAHAEQTSKLKFFSVVDPGD